MEIGVIRGARSGATRVCSYGRCVLEHVELCGQQVNLDDLCGRDGEGELQVLRSLNHDVTESIKRREDGPINLASATISADSIRSRS